MKVQTLTNSKKEKKSSRGQTTTEYVVFVMVLVSIIISLGLAFSQKIRTLVESKLGQRLKNSVFNANSMHRYRMPAP